MSVRTNIIPVILCGGLGTRLWPPQEDKVPKQFHALVTDKTLLQDTVERALLCCNVKPNDIVIVTSEKYEGITRQQLEEIHPDCCNHILSEPEPKNTAAAIAYATSYIDDNFSNNAVMWVLPSDHEVKNSSSLKKILECGVRNMPTNHILTFGIQPDSPNTQYGYIKSESGDGICKVKNFTEKPNVEIAKQYIQSGNHYWNSGMFLANIKTLKSNYNEFAPEIYNAIASNSLKNAYASLEAVPFDIAIMEKTPNVSMIKCNIGWKDVGNWENLSEEMRKKHQ